VRIDGEKTSREGVGDRKRNKGKTKGIKETRGTPDYKNKTRPVRKETRERKKEDGRSLARY